jgi:hypothetical protein
MYSLAAGAAGVSLLALAVPSEGKIVYTSTHRVIGPNSNFRLDLNHDGVTDFTLKNSTSCDTDHCLFGLRQKAAPGNSVEGIGRSGFQPYASALSRGARIGHGARFYSGLAILAYIYAGGGGTSVFGKWANVTNRYLGVKFKIKGRTHYGWARLSVSVDAGNHIVTGTLTGYAYETIPNKPIIAGKTKGADETASLEPLNPTSFSAPTPGPATLSVLALGSPGLSIWRRRRATKDSTVER